MSEMFSLSCSIPSISYFELNLETWRQLWRVLEKSDLLLMILGKWLALASLHLLHREKEELVRDKEGEHCGCFS
jgi:hypothetical protein